MDFWTLVKLVALLGVFAGALILFRSPSVYLEFISVAAKKVAPVIMAYILKRMTPEEEKRYQDAIRRGQEWDPFRKRPKDK